jgi:hypothetical protein
VKEQGPALIPKNVLDELESVTPSRADASYVGVPVAETVRQESLEDRTSYVPSRRVSTASPRSSSTMRPPSIL